MESDAITLDTKRPTTEMTEPMVRAKKLLLIVSIVGIVMFFAGLTSMHIVSKGSAEYWLQISMPQAFIISTILMILSSITMWLAVRAARKDDRSRLNMYLLMSLLLGIGFIVSQVQGWSYLNDRGMHLTFNFLEHLKGEYGVDYQLLNKDGLLIEYRDGHYYDPTDPLGQRTLDEEINTYNNPAARNMIVLSGLHAVHVFGGICWIVYLVVLGLLGKLGRHNVLKVSQGAIYWHFVDVLWILLLLFLYFIH